MVDETSNPPVAIETPAEPPTLPVDMLERMVKRTAIDIESRAEMLPLKEIANKAMKMPPKLRGFGRMLQNITGDRRVGLIPELKKKSIITGEILTDYSPARLAKAYQSGGACALAVDTEASVFNGKVEDIMEARNACTLPILRQDVLITPWQIYESRIAGADAVSLRVKILTPQQIGDLLGISKGLGMDTVLVVESMEELKTALAFDTNLISISNRPMGVKNSVLSTTFELGPKIPPDRLFLSQGGIASSTEISDIGKVGASAVIVSEALFGVQDPILECSRLLAR